MSDRLQKILGFYTVFIGVAQLVLLLVAFLAAKVFHLLSEAVFLATAVNPRFGIVSLEIILSSEGGTYTGIFAVGSGLLTIGIGILLVKELVGVFPFIFFEVLFGGPNLLVLLLQVLSVEPSETNDPFFSPYHLVVRTLVFVLSTLIPVFLATGSLLTRKKVDTLEYIPK